VPAYNHGRFVGAAVESALAQTMADLEVVVSDNCSTDETAQVVTALARKDARVRYELSPRHVSMGENFNRCLALARGEYIKFLCADDLLEPQCVTRLLGAMKEANAVLACCARNFVNEAPTATLKVVGLAKSDWVGAGDEAARRGFYFGNLIGEPTAVLFRRDRPERFAESYTQLVDLDLWLRILEHGRFAFVSEPLCRIRVHHAQATQASIAASGITADKKRLFRDFANRPYMHGTMWLRLLWDFRMAWSLQREPAPRRADSIRDALFYPGLSPAMLTGAAIARLVARA
jgi:hypothetical protein